MSLKKAIEEYKEIYLAYRNFAQRTRIEYVNDLNDLAKYLDRLGVHSVGNITIPHLVRYIAELEKRGFAGSTRKRKVISIRSFTGFLYMEGHILSDVGKRLIPPFVEPRKPRYLTRDECDRLLESAKGNIRDYAIIQILLNTGIKLSELVGLTLDDFHITNLTDKKGNKIAYIRVRGNHRGGGRIIPIDRETGRAISEYLTTRENSIQNCMFLNRNGERLGARGVEKVIEKYFILVGIGNASVNSLRHTFGTYRAAGGTSKQAIQMVMGHRDLRSTNSYFSQIKASCL